MSRRPLISIVLPVRDAEPFLDERILSIRGQSWLAWEVVAVDGWSRDGSWEKLLLWATSDPRVRLERREPDGIYPAINQCIEMARGEFIYIATSDDTMPPDCLEKLATALLAHPDCDLAHCPLETIDEAGHAASDWWWRDSIFVKSAPKLVGIAHVRRAPFDGLLHLGAASVYVSLTQLLIRRKLFDKVGLFQGRWNSVGDFNWNMRATLVANTVHVPDTWGGWRLHSKQATASVDENSPEHRRQKQEMIEHAVQSSAPHLAADLRDHLARSWHDYFLRKMLFLESPHWQKSRLKRMTWLLNEAFEGSAFPWDYVRWRLTKKGPWGADVTTVVLSWLKQCKIQNFLRPLV